MEKRTVYVASDGEIFGSPEDCQEYERFLPAWKALVEASKSKENSDYLGDLEDIEESPPIDIDTSLIEYYYMIKQQGIRLPYEESGEKFLFFVRRMRAFLAYLDGTC